MLNSVLCQEKTDSELVNLTKQNSSYFACLISRYEQRLLGYIFRLSRLKKDEAEDVLQETFIKVFYNLEDFDHQLKFSSWIYRIAHNVTIDYLRKKKTKIFVSLTTEDWQNIASKSDLIENLNQKFDRQNLLKTINQMETKYQEVIILKFLEGYDYQEISDILKKPMGTIATLINRAKKKLKQELSKNYF